MEKRKYPRAAAILKVEYNPELDAAGDYLTDLSEGGIFIRTTVPFEVGSTIYFAISFPGLLDPVPLGGVVRWKKLNVGPQEQGVGVEFVFRDEQTRNVIRDLVHKIGTPPAVPSAPRAPFRILLVDDNPIVLDLFSRALKHLHADASAAGACAQIISASRGNQALQLLESEHFDLAIFDQYLPEISGLSLARMARANPKSAAMPIVLVSAPDEELERWALASGVDLFLAKPLQASSLLSTVSALLQPRAPEGGVRAT